MTAQQKTEKPRKKKTKDEETEALSTGMSEGDKQKLQNLDEFIEGVLQEAGEEFLDKFKQVEGQ